MPPPDPTAKPVRAVVASSFGGQGWTSVLFDLVRQFTDGTLPNIPIKKTLVLLWKTLLVTLGGHAALKQDKEAARAAAGLPPSPPARAGAQPKPATTAPGGVKGSFPKPLPRGERAPGFPPKTSQANVDDFTARMNDTFYGYRDPVTKKPCPPPAVREALRVLEARKYTSLGEVQARQEAELEKAALMESRSAVIEHGRSGPVEDLYADQLPHMLRNSIALLRLVLAAMPGTANTAPDAQPWLALQGELRAGASPATVAEAAIDGMDEMRLKEVVLNAISSILLLMAKHFRLNHIYQFEHLCWTLMEARAVPLLLKLLNRPLDEYVWARSPSPAITARSPPPSLTKDLLGLSPRQVLQQPEPCRGDGAVQCVWVLEPRVDGRDLGLAGPVSVLNKSRPFPTFVAPAYWLQVGTTRRDAPPLMLLACPAPRPPGTGTCGPSSISCVSCTR